MSKSGAAAAADAECADSDRLCDYKDCRKPLHKLLLCSKCKRTAYCCKECQVRPVSRAPVHVHSGVPTCMHTHHHSHANSLTLSPPAPACFTRMLSDQGVEGRAQARVRSEGRGRGDGQQQERRAAGSTPCEIADC